MWVNGQAGEPVVRLAVLGLPVKLEASERRQFALVAKADGSAACDLVFERPQLCPADRSEKIAHAVVEPDTRVLVVRSRVARLRGEMPRTVDERAALRNEHAATARRDDLVAVEREGGATAERSRRSCSI